MSTGNLFGARVKRNEDPQLLTGMLGQLVLIRTFEEYVLELATAGLVHGPAGAGDADFRLDHYRHAPRAAGPRRQYDG